MAQPHPEPSMEDILASIKRIIAEDSEAVGARPAKLRRDAMAAVAASQAVVPAGAAEPEAEAPPPAQDEPEAAAPETAAVEERAVEERADTPDVLELTSPMTEAAPEFVNMSADLSEAPAPAAQPAHDGLLSSTSAEASRNAFAALSQLQVREQEGRANTLEGLVADLLKPMLREWLDRELPALVERLVSAEVKRLAGG